MTKIAKYIAIFAKNCYNYTGDNMKKHINGKYSDFKYAVGATDIYNRTFHDDFYELYFLMKGQVEYVSGNTRAFVEPGQLVIVPPGYYHQFLVMSCIDEYERCVLNIYPSIADENLINSAFDGKEIIYISSDDRIYGNFMYLYNEMNRLSEEDFAYICDSTAVDLIITIKNLKCNSDIDIKAPEPEMQSVMLYINEHYSEELSLEMLAKKIHFSVSSLCHRFKKEFGISINKYIKEKRMDSARRAIRNGIGAMSASEMCGYKSYPAFYRCFTAYYGISPSEEAKKYKNKRKRG